MGIVRRRVPHVARVVSLSVEGTVEETEDFVDTVSRSINSGVGRVDNRLKAEQSLLAVDAAQAREVMWNASAPVRWIGYGNPAVTEWVAARGRVPEPGCAASLVGCPRHGVAALLARWV